MPGCCRAPPPWDETILFWEQDAMNFFGFSSNGSGASQSGRKLTKAPRSRDRHHYQLLLEALEDRTLPSATVISGYVFNDLNNTSIMQSGDPPLANNPIELLNSSNTVVGSTVTNASGYYQFNQDATVSTSVQTISKTVTIPLTPTDFQLSGLVSQFNPAVGTLQSVSISNAGSITSDVKAENTSTSSPSTITATIGGDLLLTGPGGLTINTSLQQYAGTFNATTFDGTLDFAGTSGKDFGSQTASGTQSLSLSGSAMAPFLGTGTVQMTENATATSTASGGGNLLISATSDAAAQITVTYSYIANNSLQPGNYTIVELSTPPGYLDGKNSSNGVPLNNKPGNNVIPVTVTSGNIPNNDFGKLLPSSLSGYVYADVSPTGYNDGIMEPGEPGLPGVTITLTGTNDLGPVNAVTTTNAQGYYVFANLRPGVYSITETHPAGWVDGKDTIGTPGGTVGPDVFANITLPNGYNGINNNFGELKYGEISGTVFLDTSTAGYNNGIQDPGEPGIAGVTIQLNGVDLGNNPVTLSTVTDANGNYQFANLAPGTYTITKIPPAGYVDGKEALGTLGGQMGTDQFINVALPPGGAGDHYNFAELTAVIAPPVISSTPPGQAPSAPLFPPTLASTPSFITPAVPVTTKGQLLASSPTTTDVEIQSDARFINSIYNVILGRNADASGLAGWLSYLRSGGTRSDLVQLIWNSTEHRMLEIYAIYQTILGSTPDQATVNYYLGFYNAGATELNIAAAIAASPQATGLYSTTSSYIVELYALALGRTPSQAEINEWASTNMPRQTMAGAILMSAESLGDIIQRSVQTILGRPATSAEIANWTAAMQSGVSFGIFIETLLDSAEYNTLVG
jgi:hypothetical protein